MESDYEKVYSLVGDIFGRGETIGHDCGSEEYIREGRLEEVIRELVLETLVEKRNS